jgi:hypothetical protein
VVLVLLFGTTALALVLTLKYHLGIPGTVVTFAFGLPGLYLGWVAVQAALHPPAQSLADIADGLAGRLRSQWDAEVRMRRLNEPYPLPVSWIAADQSLTDSWDSLEQLARSGAGRPAPSSPETWATGPDGLAGKGVELVDKLALVPTGRLVVLGEPGAGKTMLMVRLVLDLLASRAVGPVPFLVSLASWNPTRQDLRAWLAAQLIISHPVLADPPPSGTGRSQAAALLASGLILPVLDGLDEIPDAVRGPAINKINEAVSVSEQLVVTCRTQQYRDAVRPPGGVEVTLRGAAAVQLSSLNAEAVRHYLCADAAGPVMRARWDPVLAVLGTGSPAGQALTTPLMVSLARTIYNPRPGEGAEREPEELCDPDLTDRKAVESLLFDAFIPAAYRDKPARRREKAQKRLVFLARHLEGTIGDTDLAWWQFARAVPRLKRSAPLAYVYGPKGAVSFAQSAGRGGRGALPGESSAMSPEASLAVNLRGSIAGAMVSGVWVAVLVTVVTTVLSAFLSGSSLSNDVADGVGLGILFGIGGTIWAFFQAAWPQYEIARVWLALRRRLPWSLMSFLADAHQRGVLWQAGAVYQFRHIELQHRLATREPETVRIRQYFDVRDNSGNEYRVTLRKVIDPAKGADEHSIPDDGKRFVGAVFRIKALSGSLKDENANNAAVAIGTNGRTYPHYMAHIARYTNFDGGPIHVAEGKTAKGAVTFKVPDGVKMAKVQWTPASGSGITVQWKISR